MDEQQRSLKERLNYIENSLNKTNGKEEKSKFKIPFRGKLSKPRVKKNWVTVELIHENGNIEFTKAQIINGTISIEGIPRISTVDYTTYYKGKPLIILPGWSMKPFSPADNYEDTIKENMTIAGRRLIIERMKLDAIKPKGGGFGIIGWIILGVIVLGVGYYLISGGKLF